MLCTSFVAGHLLSKERFLSLQLERKVNQQDSKLCMKITVREHSGSSVECLTRDRGVAGLSLTDGTALCP